MENNKYNYYPMQMQSFLFIMAYDNLYLEANSHSQCSVIYHRIQGVFITFITTISKQGCCNRIAFELKSHFCHLDSGRICIKIRPQTSKGSCNKHRCHRQRNLALHSMIHHSVLAEPTVWIHKNSRGGGMCIKIATGTTKSLIGIQ